LVGHTKDKHRRGQSDPAEKKMKLKYTWYESEAYDDGILRPTCTAIDRHSARDECLANFLVDDGGMPYPDALPWVDACVEKVLAVKGGILEAVDWSRDAWGAEISPSVVKIYSLYDESFCSTISLHSFEIALLSWRNFVQAGPQQAESIETEI